MHRWNKRALALLCTTAFAAPAFAQGTAEEAQEQEFANDDGIIIVTATRRAEDVQAIPIAVTAVDPVTLERQGVDNVSEITQVAPSFSTSNAQLSSNSVVLRIRGIGTTSNNIGFESAVGVFIDGAYQSRSGIALAEFVDIERVEVLRGPQGTLFGRNTSAGALNIINKRPDVNEFGGFVNASYGNFNLVSVQGAVNVPVVQDTLALRVTGAYRERDGYIDVVDGSGNKIGESNEIDQFLVRGQLGFESPGGIRGRIIGDYSESDASFGAGVEIFATPLEPFLALTTGQPRGGMANIPANFDPFDINRAEDVTDNLTATANFAPISRSEQWGITGEIEVPIGDNIDMIYIGSYREYDAFEAYDSDFSGLDVFNVTGVTTDIQTMTHELRFQGELLGGRLEWMIGGYYSEEDIRSTQSFALGADFDPLVGALLAGATMAPGAPAGIFYAAAANNPGLGLNPAQPLAFLTGASPNGTTSTSSFFQDSKSYSIFTHNTFEVTDGLDFTLGLRYSDESKDGGFTQTANSNAVCPSFFADLNMNMTPDSLERLGQVVGTANPALSPAQVQGTVNALAPTVFGLSCFGFTAPAIGPLIAGQFPLPANFNVPFDDEELIYTVKLGYEFPTIPINVYASFTHGYKSGGINLDTTAASGGLDTTFASEEVDAYEVGMKAKLFDRRLTLNIAGFHQKFSNIQVLEFTGAAFQTFNVPKAETTGVEIEMVARPTDNFTINGGLTIMDAHYPTDCAPAGSDPRVLNLCGEELTNAPDVVGILGATYERDISDRMEVFLNGQMRYEGENRTTTQATFLTNDQEVLFGEQRGNMKINLRAGIGSQDKSWSVEGWVTNLTNEVTRGTTINTVLRGSEATNARTAFPQEPRTYGVTVRGRF